MILSLYKGLAHAMAMSRLLPNYLHNIKTYTNHKSLNEIINYNKNILHLFVTF